VRLRVDMEHGTYVRQAVSNVSMEWLFVPYSGCTYPVTHLSRTGPVHVYGMTHAMYLLAMSKFLMARSPAAGMQIGGRRRANGGTGRGECDDMRRQPIAGALPGNRGVVAGAVRPEHVLGPRIWERLGRRGVCPPPLAPVGILPARPPWDRCCCLDQWLTSGS
jgi:hypothetical protein